MEEEQGGRKTRKGKQEGGRILPTRKRWGAKTSLQKSCLLADVYSADESILEGDLRPKMGKGQRKCAKKEAPHREKWKVQEVLFGLKSSRSELTNLRRRMGPSIMNCLEKGVRGKTLGALDSREAEGKVVV